jgi:hypothetical protein
LSSRRASSAAAIASSSARIASGSAATSMIPFFRLAADDAQDLLADRIHHDEIAVGLGFESVHRRSQRAGYM